VKVDYPGSRVSQPVILLHYRKVSENVNKKAGISYEKYKKVARGLAMVRFEK
jgi:hypothetical protein